MKNLKSWMFLVIFLCFFDQYAQTSSVKFISINEVLIHQDYSFFQSINENLVELDISELTLPYASETPLMLAISEKPLKHISSSAGDESPVYVCQGESLTISSTFTSSNSEYIFRRIRNNIDNIIQHRSPNFKLELTANNYQHGDIFYIQIFDLNVTPAQEFESDRMTVEILTLPSGAGVFDGNTIEQADQVICYGGTPEELTTTGEATNVNFTYQWEQSTDNGNSFTAINLATNPSLIFAAGVTETTIYRRSTQWAAGGACIKYTNEHRVTVLENNPGVISTNTTSTICYDTQPPLLENIIPATINTGDLTYQWEVSRDAINWFFTGSSTLNYQPSNTLTTTHYYRRASIQRGNSQTCPAYSNTVTITVLREIPLGTLTGEQIICFKAIPSAITSDYGTTIIDPNLGYQWLSSLDGESYTEIAGQTSSNLTFSSGDSHLPPQTTYYKLKASELINGVNCFTETESVTIEVLPLDTTLTTSAASNTICEGDDVTISAQGSNTFQFIVNGLIRSDVSANQLLLKELTETTTVTVIATNKGCEKVHTIVVKVLEIDPGEIDLSIEDCTDTSSYKLRSQNPGTSYGKTISSTTGGTYQWQLSTDGTTWQDIFGATSQTLDIGGVYNYAPPVYYRRITSQEIIPSQSCQKPSNVIHITKEPILEGGTTSPSTQSVCGAVTTTTTTISVTNGTQGSHVRYQWEKSINDGDTYTEISGQTSTSLVLTSLSQTALYRRKVVWTGDDSCPEYSSIHKVVYLQNNPGVISTSTASICFNEIPPLINNKTSATVNSGSLNYDWEISMDGNSWKSLGKNSVSYQPTNTTTQTHYYRRKSIQNANGILCENYTNSIRIHVFPDIQPKIITGAQDICVGEKPSLPLTYQSHNSSITYQWMSSIDGKNFTPINGAISSVLPIDTNASFTPTQTTHYFIILTLKQDGVECISYTDTTTVVVFDDDFGLTYTASSTVFCNENSLTFNANGIGEFSFYVDGILAQGPSTQTSFTIVNPKKDITITLINKKSAGCSNQTSLTLTYQNIYGGEISGPTSVCANNQSILLRSILPGTINEKVLTTNTFNYQWQSSLDGINYTDVLNATTEEYTLSLLTTDTHFRRLLKNTSGGTLCEESSNSIKISLSNSASQPSSVQVSTSLCNVGIYATYQGGYPPYEGELYDTDQNLIDSGSTNGSQSFENLFPGKFYTLKVTDSNCSLPKEIVIKVPFEINFDRNKVSLQYDLCKEQPTDQGQGRISIGADAFTGGSNTFNYSWTGPDSFTGEGADISGLLPGTYLLTATDEQLGCTQTESFVILGKAPLTTTLRTTNLALDSDDVYQLSCQNDSSSAVEVNVSGGHGKYTYSWKKNGEVITANQTNKLTDISTGVYEVTVTDVPPAGVDVSNPCQTLLSFKIQAPIPLSIRVGRTALETASCENTSLEVPVTIAGGVAPYTVTIGGHGSITTSQNSYTFTNVDPKKLGSNLKVSVVDQGNCSVSAPDIALQSTGQYSFVSSTTNIDCLKGTLGAIQLTLSQPLTGTQPLQLEWKGDTVHYFDTWTNGNGLLKNLNNPGTYTVTVTNSNGCVVHTESFKIEDISKGKLAVTIGQQKATTACGSANGAIQLEISGGYPPYAISWQQRSQTNSWTTLSVYDDHALISGLSSGSFRAIISDASTALNNDRCSEKITTRDITIQQQNLKIVQFTTSGAAELCDANGTGQIRFQIQNTLTTTGTTTYNYQIDGVAVSLSQINDQTNMIEIQGISPGDHRLSVLVKSGNNDCTISQDFSIDAPLEPITFSGQRTYEYSLCNEATQIKIQTEDINGGTPFETDPPYALEWHYLPSEGDTSNISHTRYGWEINNALSGTYQLVISDANGCQNDTSAPIIIKVEAPSAEPITVKGILESDTGERVKALPVACGDQDKGTIGISIEGGIQPFEVRWYLFDPESIINGNSTNGLTHLSALDNQTLLNEVPVGIYKLEIKTLNTECASGTSIYSYHTEDIEITPNPNLHILSGPFIEDTLCEGKPGRVTIEIFDNNQGNLYFYYEGKAIQKEVFEQINDQTYTLLIENPVEEGELEILNAEGCSIKHKINLALGTPDFSFTSSSLEITNNILTGEEITFTNNSSNPYVKSEWLFGDLSPPLVQSHTATSSTVKYTYPTSGAYPVTLRIYNKNGCMEQVTLVVSVGKGYNITLPNVFSPNNDGMNDHFRPLFSGFQEIEFSIFDPRGNQLYFESMKEPNPDHVEGFQLTGWDASNANQALYYIYSVRGILFDKTEIDKSGTFILLQ